MGEGVSQYARLANTSIVLTFPPLSLFHPLSAIKRAFIFPKQTRIKYSLKGDDGQISGRGPAFVAPLVRGATWCRDSKGISKLTLLQLNL